MNTALAADEPDEPERRKYLTSVATGMSNVYYTGYTMIPVDRIMAAGTPSPWQCPDCKTWMAPAVTEHRCQEA